MPVHPRLLGHQPRSASGVSGVALILNGGRANGKGRARGNQLASLRMIPFARSIRTAGSDLGVATYRLRYRLRGWNAEAGSPVEPDPVADARWAIAEIARRHGDVPVVLVGHSMGGRAVLWVADGPTVAGVVALAPWCEPADPVEQLAGRDVLIAHGTGDRITSPAKSLAFAERARAAGADVRRLEVQDSTHSMLRRAGFWHQLATSYVLQRLGHPAVDPSVSRPGPNADRGRATTAPDVLRLQV